MKYASQRVAYTYFLGALGLFPSADLGTVNLVGTGTLLLACVGIALLGLFAPRRAARFQLLLFHRCVPP